VARVSARGSGEAWGALLGALEYGVGSVILVDPEVVDPKPFEAKRFDGGRGVPVRSGKKQRERASGVPREENWGLNPSGYSTTSGP
jgi:hypothetical protein